MEDNKTYTIHDLPLNERPRERLKLFGPETLSSPELLAILLSTGRTGESVVTLSYKLIMKFDGLQGVLSASYQELCKVSGIGLAKASTIKAVHGLFQRMSFDAEVNSIISTEDIYKAVISQLRGKKTEHLLSINLDEKQRIINIITISKGLENKIIINPKMIFQEAIRSLAAYVILVHNHPSGDTTPSKEDIVLTEQLIAGGEMVGVTILNHVIVTDTKYLSLINFPLS